MFGTEISFSLNEPVTITVIDFMKCKLMSDESDRTLELVVGVIVRRSPGITRWVKWQWKPIALIPGATDTYWKELHRDGENVDFHASTEIMTLYRSDVEAYRVSLSMTPPSVFVILDPDDDSPAEYSVQSVTASAYEAQDALDSGTSIVEALAIPEILISCIEEFTFRHYRDTPFLKRKRDSAGTGTKQDGVGDMRIRQYADVYRSPSTVRSRRDH